MAQLSKRCRSIVSDTDNVAIHVRVTVFNRDRWLTRDEHQGTLDDVVSRIMFELPKTSYCRTPLSQIKVMR